MTLESMADRVGGLSNRRKFLGRLAGAGLASLGYLGLTARDAQALCNTHGCQYCQCPTSCSYTCAWCWWGSCHTHSGGGRYQHKCCEGFGPVSPSYCSPSNCSVGFICSFQGGTRAC